MTLIWSFLLVNVLNYVVGSIANLPFDFQTGAILSVVLAVLVSLLGEAIPEDFVPEN